MKTGSKADHSYVECRIRRGEKISSSAVRRSDFSAQHHAHALRHRVPRKVCSTNDAETDKIALYYEPMPRAVGPLPEAMAAGLRVHKLILMDTKEAIDRVRPDVERLIGERATFTQVRRCRSSGQFLKKLVLV